LKDTTYQSVSEDSVPSDDTPSLVVDPLEVMAVEEPTSSEAQIWTDDDHLRVALRIAPVWFIANWSYNASLMYTTITSSTVFASTSSLFTFLMAVMARDESFSWIRLVGTLLGVSGGMLTALHDIPDRRRLPEDEGAEHGGLALFGDMLGLVSAVGYGVYAVQTRVYCPKDESLYSMQLVLGYIGLLNMVLLSPVAIYILLGSRHLEWLVLGAVVLKGFFDNFLRYVRDAQCFGRSGLPVSHV
jgi:solute carrier family 35 protein F5